MARVTVEDCIDKVESPYELVLVAKERTTQLNAGVEPTVSADNDKNTVISLREIAQENIKVPELIESAIYKLRKHVEQIDDTSSEDEEVGDDFENLYKGEISKSGAPILPSKRARKIPEKIQVSKEDSSEIANEIADRVVQIFGGRGYMRENVAERYYRELRVDRIWEGTSEIQRHIISRSLLRPLGA